MVNINKKNIFKIIGISIIVFVLVGYVLLPAINTIITSFDIQNKELFKYYKEFFLVYANKRALFNTIILGFSTVLVCGLIGTILALAVNYFDFPLKKIIDKVLLLPIIFPGVIIVIAFIQLYGESGLITKSIEIIFNLEKPPFMLTGFYGILFVHAYTQYVYFYTNVSIAIKHIDQSVIEAAKNLGASKFKVFTSVIIPFIKPALYSAAILTFMSGVASFSAPIMIGDGFKVLTTQMLFAKSNNHIEIASVQVVLLSLISIIFLLTLRYYERKSSFQTSVKGVKINPKKIENKVFRFAYVVILLSVTFFILLPIITIIILSFVKPGTWMIEIFPREFSLDNYIKIFTKSRAMEPFINSFNMSVLAIIFSTIVAVPCSFLIVRGKGKIKTLVEILAMLPWVIPTSAMAINLINFFNKGNIFSFNKVLVGSYIILPLAYAIIILPIILRSTNISLYSLNENYEDASRSLGASYIMTFRKIVIPLIMPGIVYGVGLGFIKSIGEYNLSTYLYSVKNKPISIAMVNGVFEYDLGLAMAYGVLVIIMIGLLSLFKFDKFKV